MSNQYMQESRDAMNRVFSTMKEERGMCARFTWQMGISFVKGTTPAAGARGIANCGTQEYYNAIVNTLGYTQITSERVTKQALITDLAQDKYPCGTIVAYQAKEGDPNESAYKYGHTQFYIGESKWTSSVRYNYGKNGNYASFVYYSVKCNNWDYHVFTPPQPCASSNPGSVCDCNPGGSSKVIGIKNNNPLNIRNSNDCFNGECDCDKNFNCTKNENNFKTFVNMDYGYRAAFVTLGTYVDKYKCNTIRKIVTKWAPPNENKTSSYIDNVAADSGVGADEVLYLTGCGEKFRQIVKAMSVREVGWFDVEAIQRGFNLQDKIKE